MRIGDLSYLDRTKRDADTTENCNPPTPELTERQKKWKKWKNWWYYHKWYVICGVILLGILLNVTGNYLGLWSKSPDLQVAYIGRGELPTDTVSALEQAFASLAADFNGDGEIIVRINQYISGLPVDDPDMVSYEYASELSLIGDISDCESYFFLMDDPLQFQRNFQLIAAPDGNCPDDTDYSVEDKIIPWTSCPLLSGMELGAYSTSILGQELSGNNQELLAGLFLGRRCFFNDDRTAHADKCSELWDLLYECYRQETSAGK